MVFKGQENSAVSCWFCLKWVISLAVLIPCVLYGICLGWQSWIAAKYLDEDLKKVPENRRWLWRLQHFVNHLIGAITGGFLVLVLLFCYRKNILEFSYPTVLIACFALLGITGFLPTLLWGLAGSFKFIIDKVSGKFPESKKNA